LFQAKKKGTEVQARALCCLLICFYNRKYGIELKGPDKSYFLWAATKEAVEVRAPLHQTSFVFTHALFLNLIAGFLPQIAVRLSQVIF
jgi:hypothetical protein